MRFPGKCCAGLSAQTLLDQRQLAKVLTMATGRQAGAAQLLPRAVAIAVVTATTNVKAPLPSVSHASRAHTERASNGEPEYGLWPPNRTTSHTKITVNKVK